MSYWESFFRQVGKRLDDLDAQVRESARQGKWKAKAETAGRKVADGLDQLDKNVAPKVQQHRWFSQRWMRAAWLVGAVLLVFWLWSLSWGQQASSSRPSHPGPAPAIRYDPAPARAPAPPVVAPVPSMPPSFLVPPTKTPWQSDVEHRICLTEQRQRGKADWEARLACPRPLY